MKVLLIIDHYLPSFKAGGPLRSVPNLINKLESVNFSIITRDRDLGSNIELKNIEIDKWSNAFGVRIYYSSPRKFSLFKLFKTMRDDVFDTIYLNSLFSLRATIFPLLFKYAGFFPNVRFVLAPRGELSPGALKDKKLKKYIYLTIVKKIGLYEGTIFHATSSMEVDHIRKHFPNNLNEFSLVQNAVSLQLNGAFHPTINSSEDLKIIFLSRIVSKKNLIFLLDVLQHINVKVKLSIFGTIEDQRYWLKCQSKILDLPENVIVEYKGEVEPDEVVKTFGNYDLFVFPTKGENFGHVVFESLSAGTPVLLSDETPWSSPILSTELIVLNLAQKEAWIDAITMHANLSQKDRFFYRNQAFKHAQSYAEYSFDKVTMLKLLGF